MVYIREAHPSDGWQVAANERQGVVFSQPTSWEDRVKVVDKMCDALEISLPAIVDKLDDKVNQAYSAWPDRLYLVGKDGKIAYKGEQGPFGFKPAGLEKAIQEEVAKNAKK